MWLFRTRKKYGEHNEAFVYMQALVFVQCAINTLVALLAIKSKQNATTSDNVPFSLYSMCSTSYFLAMLFSNLALEWINYPTQVHICFFQNFKFYWHYAKKKSSIIFRFLESRANPFQSCCSASCLRTNVTRGENIFTCC